MYAIRSYYAINDIPVSEEDKADDQEELLIKGTQVTGDIYHHRSKELESPKVLGKIDLEPKKKAPVEEVKEPLPVKEEVAPEPRIENVEVPLEKPEEAQVKVVGKIDLDSYNFV